MAVYWEHFTWDSPHKPPPRTHCRKSSTPLWQRAERPSSYAYVTLHPALIMVPVLLLPLAALAIGFGLIVAPLQVYFRDVEHIMGAIGLPWIFLSPVFYTFAQAPGFIQEPG